MKRTTYINSLSNDKDTLAAPRKRTAFGSPFDTNSKMNRYYLSIAVLSLSTLSLPAQANCSLYLGASGNCQTNSRGETVITTTNLGGGYTSTNTRTGEESYTGQDINGGWTTRYRDGRSSYSTQDPYPNLGRSRNR